MDDNDGEAWKGADAPEAFNFFRRYYMLDARGEPVVTRDFLKSERWFENSWPERQVAETFVGKARISTVFIWLDHNYSSKGPPILWETMVFGGPKAIDETQGRCSGSREQAQAMHEKMVCMVERKLKLKRKEQVLS